MKNKGFTLIELLAVIVILAIIALIATPIILNIIDDTKEESVKRSIDHYMSAATTAIVSKNLNNVGNGVNSRDCTILSDGNLSCDGTKIEVEVDGTKPTGGSIQFENGKIISITVIMLNNNTYVTGEIYRNELEYLSIGDDIIETKIEYETSLSNISNNVYLKHEVENNIVTASYACITYTETGIRKDTCVRGGDSSYHASNLATLRNLSNIIGDFPLGSCDIIEDDISECGASSFSIAADPEGYVDAVDGITETFGCAVEKEGLSYCYER